MSRKYWMQADAMVNAPFVSHVEALGSKSCLHFWFQLLANVHPGRQEDVVVIGDIDWELGSWLQPALAVWGIYFCGEKHCGLRAVLAWLPRRLAMRCSKKTTTQIPCAPYDVVLISSSETGVCAPSPRIGLGQEVIMHDFLRPVIKPLYTDFIGNLYQYLPLGTFFWKTLLENLEPIERKSCRESSLKHKDVALGTLTC